MSGASTLRRCRDRLERRAYVDGSHFASDVRNVHSSVLAVTSRHLPPSWQIHGREQRSGPSLDDVLHAAQVFVSAFESKWRELVRHKLDATPRKPNLVKAKRAAAAAWRAERASARNASSAKTGGDALVGKTVEVYWDGDEDWYTGKLTKFRERDGKHCCEYEDDTSEWLLLADHTVRFLDARGDPDAARDGDGDAPLPHTSSKDVDAFSCQKLGKLVWAKSGAHPWWPAEICLLAVEELRAAIPFRHSDKATRKCMVLYFGETQFDMLKPGTNVMSFDPNQPTEKVRGKPDADLKLAIQLALARAQELDAL